MWLGREMGLRWFDAFFSPSGKTELGKGQSDQMSNAVALQAYLIREDDVLF